MYNFFPAISYFSNICLSKKYISGSSSRQEPHLHSHIYSYHIFEPLLKYSFNYFHAMHQKLNTFVSSTQSNIFFSYVDWYQVTPSPAFRHFFSLKQFVATSANFFALLVLHTFSNSDIMPLHPTTFYAFMRFSASATAFTCTFSQDLSFFFIQILHSFSSFSSFYLCSSTLPSIFQTQFYISIFITTAWHSNNILVVCLTIPNRHFNASDLFCFR